MSFQKNLQNIIQEIKEDERNVDYKARHSFSRPLRHASISTKKADNGSRTRLTSLGS